MINRPLPVHAEIEAFPVASNCLVVGGSKITELADAAGRTPFYAYDSALITKRIRTIRDAFPEQLKLHYAVKANPMPAVVDLISRNVDGLDIASAGEMLVALDAEMPAAEISFAGPGKQEGELQQAVSAGIVVTVESANEMRRLARIGQTIDRKPLAAVRVNPDFELKSSGMKMSGGPKPFGIDAELVPEVLREFRSLPLEFAGLHIFCGSQNLNTDSIIKAQTKTLDLALNLSKDAPAAPRFINIGGGLGIPYFKGDKPLELQSIGKNLAGLGQRLASELPGTDMVIELGRYIVGEAGVYVCRVVDRKVSRGTTYLVTDGGLHHHLAASGNFGQVIRKNYPIVVGNRVFSDKLEQQSVVGPLCTPLDILADKMMLSPAQVADFIVVFQSGAYGFTASPLGFLSHPRPAEILV